MAVLVAISIPIFTSQLEKSREATDAANLRAAYAEISAEMLTWDGTSTITPKEVAAKQTQANWQSVDYSTAPNEIGGLQVAASTKGWTVSADTTNNIVKIEVQK
nr:hypothetical protein [uncultured Blautia sp.]